MAEGKSWRIGEVAELLNLKTHVLRFWETEFPQIEPLRTDSGQRIYTEDHINMLRRIQQLLHEQGMTIEGARRVLAGSAVIDENSPGNIAAIPDPEFLSMLEAEISAICKLLRQGGQT